MGNKSSVAQESIIVKTNKIIITNPDVQIPKLELIVNNQYTIDQFIILIQQIKPEISLIDLDGTIIDMNLISFYIYYLKTLPKIKYYKRFVHLLVKAPLYFMLDKINRDYFQDSFYKNYNGENYLYLEKISKNFFNDYAKHHINKNVLCALEELKKYGDAQILTSNINYLTKDIAHNLNIKKYYSQEFLLDEENNIAGLKFDSGIKFKQIIANNLSKKSITLGIGDSVSDIPFLETCSFGFLYNKKNETFTYII